MVICIFVYLKADLQMELSLPIILVLAILSIITVVLWMKYQNALSTIRQAESKDQEIQLELQSVLAAHNLDKERLTELKIDIATLESNHTFLQEQINQYRNDKEVANEQFQLIASKVLDEKSAKMEHDHNRSIREMLEPLKERIKTFESRIEQNTKEDIARHSSLKEQIIGLAQLNERMTLETTNLTKALKGDNKIQGNWGELILENILQKSGLEKDREYFVQQSHTTESGKRLMPDMLIKTPDEKVYVIDSKVSLVAYEKYVNSESKEEEQTALKAHTLSIKSHIDGLAKKKYHDLYKIESPDFVLMFIPIETAFAATLKLDTNIYQYAFDQQVVIVTPSTLLATLKTVETMWRNEKQQKYALDIADQAGKMYDKFHSFTEDMSKIDTRLNQLRNSYDDAMNKLSTGKGNLVNRAEKIKELGAKANKKLSKELLGDQ